MVGYLDPSSAAVGYVGAVAVNIALGGTDSDMTPAVEFFKELHEEPADRAEADVLCARRVRRDPDPVRLRLQRLSRQIRRERQFRIRHSLRRHGGLSLRDEPGEERARQGQGGEGARLFPVRQGPGDVGQCLSAPGAADRAAGSGQKPSSCPTANMPAPRASTGRRWKRCKRHSPTATSPKCDDASIAAPAAHPRARNRS